MGIRIESFARKIILNQKVLLQTAYLRACILCSFRVKWNSLEYSIVHMNVGIWLKFSQAWKCQYTFSKFSTSKFKEMIASVS